MKIFGIFATCLWAGVLAKSRERRATNSTSIASPVVDLGYEVYEGYYNATSELDIFKGYV
jgi:hypothetical protein